MRFLSNFCNLVSIFFTQLQINGCEELLHSLNLLGSVKHDDFLVQLPADQNGALAHFILGRELFQGSLEVLSLQPCNGCETHPALDGNAMRLQPLSVLWRALDIGIKLDLVDDGFNLGSLE